ncbi:hypothetical protein [Solibacillus sp. FSL H8-0538]|uniref:hypothetical protein n=1 Tax=Solibacillus sp. FSL H8-0538 TaxID=2921400 RepID=UPI0030FB74D8
MKQLTAIFLAMTLMFSSVGTTLFFGDEHQVEAKSYKSGKKSYNNNSNTNNNTNIQNKDTDTTTNQNPTTTNKTTDSTKTPEKSKGGFSAGGLMKGLLIGGIAGMLFGSIFGDMGLIGSILGFAINALAIGAIIFFLVKIFKMVTRKKDKEVSDGWKN